MTAILPLNNFRESEWCLTRCPEAILLQVRTGEGRAAASSTLGAAHVRAYPYAAMRHVLQRVVTARKCSKQAVFSAAEANMKNPSKSRAASVREAPPPASLCATKMRFFSGRSPVRASRSFSTLSKKRESA